MTETRSTPTSTVERFALVPLCGESRQGACPMCDDGANDSESSPIVCSECIGHTNEKTRLPFILLQGNEKTVFELGKFELVEAIQSACRRCVAEGTCTECAAVIKWVRRCIPSCLLRLQVEDAPTSTTGPVRIWVRAALYATRHYVKLMSRGTSTTLNSDKDESSNRSVSVAKDTWMGPWYGFPGDVFQFLVVPELSGMSKSGISKSGTLEFQLCRMQPSDDSTRLSSNHSVAPLDPDVTADVANTDEVKSSSERSVQCIGYSEALKTLEEASTSFVLGDQMDGQDSRPNGSFSPESQPLESQLPETHAGRRMNASTKRDPSPLLGGAPKKQCMGSDLTFPVQPMDKMDMGPELETDNAQRETFLKEDVPTPASCLMTEDTISPRSLPVSFTSAFKKPSHVEMSNKSIKPLDCSSMTVEALMPVVDMSATMENSTVIPTRSECAQEPRTIPEQTGTTPSLEETTTERLPPTTTTNGLQTKPPAISLLSVCEQELRYLPQQTSACSLLQEPTTETLPLPAVAAPKGAEAKRLAIAIPSGTSSKDTPLPNEPDVERTKTTIASTTSPLAQIPRCAGKKFVLYFVEKGRDMHKTIHIPGLRLLAERRGATVLGSFNKDQPSTWPTHFVISQQVTARESIATALGFRDIDEMVDFVHEHGIVCATRDWAASKSYDKSPYEEPTIMEVCFGFRRTKSSKLNKKSHTTVEASSPIASPKHSQSNRPKGPVRNVVLSELFHKLAKLHQQCPLYPQDDWKAYTFQMLSGRLRHVDFEIINDPDVLGRLKNVSGFGESSMQIIKEFLETGHSTRMQEFETNGDRVAMKAMMNIWGVGRVKASELVNAGYTSVDAVREAVTNGTQRLDRNQYIGLSCYEDILEEMPRKEVEEIAKTVAAAVKIRYPSAELTIMGSYRRGKLTCGDADILITHPHYVDQVPAKALGAIVDDLRAEGHIAHHLTFISGMKKENFETLPKGVACKLTKPTSYGRSVDKDDKTMSSSWMGVFHSHGKHRRVDIKFYPYAERVYAALYFTGNGLFNRSMRLWATRKKGYSLSDHGLVVKSSRVPVLLDPKSERSVFDFLGLKWKEPSERDCFDAVEGVSGENASQLPNMTRPEVTEENQTHVWIK